MSRSRDPGVVLVNVLMIVALMSSVVFAMVSFGDLSIARSQRFSEAGQAISLVLAGENSALAALRRDLARAPETDHAGEVWGQVAQQAVTIEDGSFALAITDAQGLVNLTGLYPDAARPGVLPPDPRLLPGLAEAAGLPPDSAARLQTALRQTPPPGLMSDLAAAAGLTEAQAQALAAVATLLPRPTPVNLNAAPLPVLKVLLGNPAHVRQIDAIRRRTGVLTPADLAALGIPQQTAFGFTSAYFRVTTEVTIGRTTQSFTSLIHRRLTPPDDVPEAHVIARQRSTTPAPLPVGP